MITKKIKSGRKIKQSFRDTGTRTMAETMQFLEELSAGRMTLGDTIKNIRQCDEIKQRDFAKKLRVSQAYLCDLEKNRKEISPRKAAEFAKMLGYPEKFFIHLALEDLLERQGFHYSVDVQDAA